MVGKKSMVLDIVVCLILTTFHTAGSGGMVPVDIAGVESVVEREILWVVDGPEGRIDQTKFESVNWLLSEGIFW